VRLELPAVRIEGGTMIGQVIHVDRFGNAVTDIRARDIGGRRILAVRAGGRDLPLGRTYGDVPEGSCLALWGSSGRLEVSCNRGSAAETLGLSKGSPVHLALDT
jgi:hypothetical protein